MLKELQNQENLDLLEAIVENLIVENNKIGGIVLEDGTTQYVNLLHNLDLNSNTIFMGVKEFTQLVVNGDFYYISGDIIALYNMASENTFTMFNAMRKSLKSANVRILHILEEDLYFAKESKYASSMIDGPILEEYLVERI